MILRIPSLSANENIALYAISSSLNINGYVTCLFYEQDVPCGEVEREFWRILQEYNDDVVVEYGADIHSSSQGSGFPTKSMLKNLVGTASQLAEAKKYADSPWNLNILPLLDR